jgi:two-component system sensor histidine kinase BaeS
MNRRPSRDLSSAFVLKPVPWWRTIFTKLLLFFSLLMVLLVGTTALLISLAHQLILESYVPPAVLTQLRGLVVQESIAIALFAIIASTLVVYLISRSFTRPIEQLLTAMQQVAQGNYLARVDRRQPDLFGNLATFFNSLVDRLRQIQERGEHISQLKSAFTATAAHQLRTPLTSLHWSLRSLLEAHQDPLTAKQRTVLQDSEQLAERLIHLVNELLKVSRLEQGRFLTDFKEIDLVSLIQNTLKEFAMPAKNKGLKLQFTNHAASSVRLVADPQHLNVALSNLLDNAIHYSHNNSQVKITLAANPDHVTISVQDEGIGIPAAERNKIFSRFYRAPNATKLHTEGTGLGLFIARHIVTRHGGTITFTSEENKGTTFTVTLPLHRSGVPTEYSIEEFIEGI